MVDIPDDLSQILREIDAALTAQGVPPQGRGILATIEFGKRFKISIPITEFTHGLPQELIQNSIYTKKIHAWFSEMYGERMKVDFSANAKVAVLASGDIWELRIPLLRGQAIIVSSRELKTKQENAISQGPVTINPCNLLTHITAAKLVYFSDADMAEVENMFLIGLEVRAVFDRFRIKDGLFIEAEGDWCSAVAQLLNPNRYFGQSRWASLQMCEKFMKGLIKIRGDAKAEKIHDLTRLHDVLAKSIVELDLKYLLSDIQCDPSVRYGETESTREQAYAAHRSSLRLICELAPLTDANS